MTKPLIRNCLTAIKPYVPGKPVEEVERELGLRDVIKLASNENPLGPSPLAVETLKKQLACLHYYPDGNCYYLKQELAERLKVGPENLIFGNGSDELLSLITLAYLNPGEEALAVQPTFSEYEFAVRLMEGTMRYVPLSGRDFDFDLEGLVGEVNEKTRLLFICSPNNPTGSIMRRRQLEALLDRLPPGVLVVLDQAYYEYVTDPDYPSGLEYVQEGRPVILLRTFSKIYGLAGLRIGYGIASREIVQDLNRVREPFNVNSVAQVAARAALGDQGHLERSRALVEKGRKQLQEGLARIGLSPVPPEPTLFY